MAMMKEPVLYLFCGKIAAGKSTLTAEFGARPATVVLSEDAWLAALFGDQMTTLEDFARGAAKVRCVVAPHVVDLLGAGVSVVLDFALNTVASRQWARGILDQSGARHELHVLDVPDAVCLARLRARNAEGKHPFAASEAQFHEITRYLVLPSAAEGFNIVMHRD
ncbi:MAG: ATP-binding protein [Pseudomonadota bacterium]